MAPLSQFEIFMILLVSAFTILWLVLFVRTAEKLLRKETRSIPAYLIFTFILLLLVPVIYFVVQYRLIAL